MIIESDFYALEIIIDDKTAQFSMYEKYKKNTLACSKCVGTIYIDKDNLDELALYLKMIK